MNTIRFLRKEKGVTQEDLAAAMHVSQTAVSHWERGKNMPDMAQAIELANFFGVTTDYLLGRTDNPNSAGEKSPVYSDEALEMMEIMHKRPELKLLFSAGRNVKKADVEAVNEILKRMAGYGDEDTE